MNDNGPYAWPEVALTVEPGIEPYWEGAAENRLTLSRCTQDGAYLWPPRPFCPRHQGRDIRWERVSGDGVVYSCTVVHRGEGAFAKASPYVLAYVELDAGPRVLTNLVTPDGGPAEGADIGHRVTARFDRTSSGTPVLRFVTQP
ncbi:Zn-ribbon domain-containing OB-fold protein [Streptomyces sp. NPDC096310]|uniref:Zn-ribbon domain-containing OB-fold protein n=1 Tax=Streptomyces sp. NPDC096310 TaxID=3366082 RepID=UPI003807020D